MQWRMLAVTLDVLRRRRGNVQHPIQNNYEYRPHVGLSMAAATTAMCCHEDES
jgi:hypothetical protein